MVAELLGLPQATVVTKLETDGASATALREIEGGLEKVILELPAVVTAQKGLNEPRYETLKGIMAAKKKPVPVITLDELGFGPDDLRSAVEIDRARRAGRAAGGQGPPGRSGRVGPGARAAPPRRSQGHIKGDAR